MYQRLYEREEVKEILYSFLLMEEYNKDNFHEGTYGEWNRVYKIPERKPDYISASGSSYWYHPGAVTRLSHHWGAFIGKNHWNLRGKEWEDSSYEKKPTLRAGRIKYKNLKSSGINEPHVRILHKELNRRRSKKDNEKLTRQVIDGVRYGKDRKPLTPKEHRMETRREKQKEKELKRTFEIRKKSNEALKNFINQWKGKQ